jgi:hypothetical protein
MLNRAGFGPPIFLKGLDMKKILVFLSMAGACLIILFVNAVLWRTFGPSLLFGATETHSTIDRMGRAEVQHFGSVTWDAASDVNDVTATLSAIEGYLDGMVIDATLSGGDDTNFDVIIKDEHAVTLFSKTDLDSTNEPMRYALSEADLEGNEFVGIPVDGTPSITIAGCNDANMTNIAITLYYRDHRRE